MICLVLDDFVSILELLYATINPPHIPIQCPKLPKNATMIMVEILIVSMKTPFYKF